MRRPIQIIWVCTLAITVSFNGYADALGADDRAQQCELDAILVFDASGSMAGTDWNGQVSRISHVRNALRRVLPEVTPYRRLGLISYGPGPYNKCDNIELQMKPGYYTPAQILDRVDTLLPAGRTPMTAAIKQAADVLKYRTKPAVIVLLTDGEETCTGKPCETARQLEQNGTDLTIHVVSYMQRSVADWKGVYQSRCIAGETGGLQVSVENETELVSALRKTLACPVLTRLNPPPISRPATAWKRDPH